jgi:hypothetical protein
MLSTSRHAPKYVMLARYVHAMMAMRDVVQLNVGVEAPEKWIIPLSKLRSRTRPDDAVHQMSPSGI